MKTLLVLIVLFLYTGCTTANQAFVNNDFAAAQAELVVAQKAGIIAMNNPLGPCLAAVVQAQTNLGAGLQQPVGMISLGVEVYILTEAAKQQGGGLGPDCDSVLGAIVRLGARRGLQIGAGMLMPGLPVP